MKLYETAVSILTATPGTAKNPQGCKDAVENPNDSQTLWWRRALRTQAGRMVLSQLNILTTSDGNLPADWEAHPLAEPNDGRPEITLPVTVVALREALCPGAGVMFLERRGNEAGRDYRAQELHLCAIDPDGTRAALMPVC